MAASDQTEYGDEDIGAAVVDVVDAVSTAVADTSVAAGLGQYLVECCLQGLEEQSLALGWR